jgi:hypothetical protein
MAEVEGVEVFVEAVGVVVVDVMVAVEEGVYGCAKFVGQRVGHGVGREGGIEGLEGLAHRPGGVSQRRRGGCGRALESACLPRHV